jgi:hypothetical protein
LVVVGERFDLSGHDCALCQQLFERNGRSVLAGVGDWCGADQTRGNAQLGYNGDVRNRDGKLGGTCVYAPAGSKAQTGHRVTKTRG